LETIERLHTGRDCSRKTRPRTCGSCTLRARARSHAPALTCGEALSALLLAGEIAVRHRVDPGGAADQAGDGTDEGDGADDAEPGHSPDHEDAQRLVALAVDELAQAGHGRAGHRGDHSAHGRARGSLGEGVAHDPRVWI